MPFRSKAQANFFFAREGKPGGPPKGSAKEWAAATPSIKSLPSRVAKKQTGSGRSTSRKQSPATTPSLSSSSANSISAPSKLGIARKLPDFTSAKPAKRATTPRTLTLPRAAGNRYARRGVPRSQMRSYGRSS